MTEMANHLNTTALNNMSLPEWEAFFHKHFEVDPIGSHKYGYEDENEDSDDDNGESNFPEATELDLD